MLTYFILCLGNIKWEKTRGWKVIDNDAKIILGVQTVEQCKQMCLSETDITCVSIEYGYRQASKSCHLQTVKKEDVLAQWERSPDFAYYEHFTILPAEMANVKLNIGKIVLH